jgi:hypothetical protein
VGFSLENVPEILRKSKSLKEKFLGNTFIKFPTLKTFNSKRQKNVPSFKISSKKKKILEKILSLEEK